MDSCLIERIQPKNHFTILQTTINRPVKNHMELGEPAKNHLHTSPMRRRAKREKGAVAVSRGQDLNLRPPGVCPPTGLGAAPLWARATAGRCWPPLKESTRLSPFKSYTHPHILQELKKFMSIKLTPRTSFPTTFFPTTFRMLSGIRPSAKTTQS